MTADFASPLFDINDFALMQSNVKIRALTWNTGKSGSTFPSVRNEIEFVRNNLTASVTCVHVALGNYSLETIENMPDESEILELAKTTENKIVNLLPEEHFKALTSYVAGIAEMGILEMLRSSYFSENMPNPDIAPFGFNSIMQQQIIEALCHIAPEAIAQLVGEFFDSFAGKPELKKWLKRRYFLFQSNYFLENLTQKFPPLAITLEKTFGYLHYKLERAVIQAINSNPHPQLLEALSEIKNRRVRIKIVSLQQCPQNVIDRISREDERKSVQSAIKKSDTWRVLGGIIDRCEKEKNWGYFDKYITEAIENKRLKTENLPKIISQGIPEWS